MQHLVSFVTLNTRLWINCLDDVSDDVAWTRPVAAANSLGFVALHVVDARCYLTEYVGLTVRNPYKEALAHVRRIDDLRDDERPALDDLRRVWADVSGILAPGMANLTEDTLHEASPERFPVDDPSRYGGVLFLLQHESYHIGQMALLRKAAGLPAMRYT